MPRRPSRRTDSGTAASRRREGLENEKQQRDYTYIEREEEHQLDGHGGVKKVESRTSEILEIYGEPVERLTAKDDKPLSADEAKKEDEKIQKIIDKRKNESERTAASGWRKKKRAAQKIASLCSRSPTPLTSGCWLGGVGWPRYLGARCRASSWLRTEGARAKMLTKFKGRVWIDKAEHNG